MNAFRIVKRSDVPSALLGGMNAGRPTVRLAKSGALGFSRLASDVFAGLTKTVVEFDEENGVLRFTAVEKPPKGLDEADCFHITWGKTGNTSTCAISIKGLLKYLDFRQMPSGVWQIADIDRERHSIAVVLPVGKTAEEERQPVAAAV